MVGGGFRRRPESAIDGSRQGAARLFTFTLTVHVARSHLRARDHSYSHPTFTRRVMIPRQVVKEKTPSITHVQRVLLLNGITYDPDLRRARERAETEAAFDEMTRKTPAGGGVSLYNGRSTASGHGDDKTGVPLRLQAAGHKVNLMF